MNDRKTGMRIVVVGAAVIIGVSLAASLLLKRENANSNGRRPQATASPQRIISLAPSLTEILFALKLDDRVVGVTKYCDYPAAALDKPKVGGYYDPSYEAMLGLNPDLVVMLATHEKPQEFFQRHGIDTLMVEQTRVEDILTGIEQIGRRTGVAARAKRLTARLRRRMNLISGQVQELPKPSVMVCIGRELSANRIEGLFIAGASGWYGELIEMAGGRNAYTGKIAFPSISAEGVLNLNPDVIIEMLGEMSGKMPDAKTLGKAWATMPQLKAVKNGRIHFFLDDYAVIPGPRLVFILEDLARILHPTINWDSVLEPAEPMATSPAGRE